MNKEHIKLIKIALLVICSVLVFFFSIRLLDGNAFKGNSYYYVRYNTAKGITRSTPVLIKGVTVGTVSNISLDPNNHDVIIKFSINEDLKILKSSTVLAQKNLLSSNALSITFPKDTLVKDFYHEGETLPGKMEPNLSENVQPFVTKGETLMKSAHNTLDNINGILEDDFKKDLHRTFSNLAQLTAKVNAIMLNKEKQISQIIENTQLLTKNLGVAVHQMTLLLEDIRLYPKRYIHFSFIGRKGMPYKSMEKKSTSKKLSRTSKEQ